MGTSCSGKSTLAEAVGAKTNLPVTHLDDLFWNPGWVETPLEAFRDKVRRAVFEENWIIDGNYSRIAELTRNRATEIVWLHLPFTLVFARCLKRTMGRAVTGAPCCNGNRESLRRSFLSRDSIILWVLRSHRKARQRYAREFAPGQPNVEKVTRLDSRRAIQAWLEAL